MSTKIINDMSTKTISDMTIKKIGLLIGILCLGLATYHLVYVEVNDDPGKVPNNITAVQPVTAERPLWIAMSRIGLFMSPIRDCVESLNDRKRIPNNLKAIPEGLPENRTSSIDKFFHDCCHIMPIIKIVPTYAIAVKY
jgi:hypothetical protein